MIALLGPVPYLVHHRGITHSVLLMPLWAWLLAVAFAWLGRRRFAWTAYYGVCLLALGIHILGDLITSYGTQVLAPFSTWAPGLDTTFIIDPWFSGILLTGLVLSWYVRPRLVAAGTLALITGVVLLQHTQYREARDVARAYAMDNGIRADRIVVLPQPLSWFNWKAVIVSGETYRQAGFNLLTDRPREDRGADQSWLTRLRAEYQPVEHARWTRHRQFGDGGQDPLARAVWSHKEFAFYRRFARLPVVNGVETVDEELCVWFHDLRFEVMDRASPFRFGMCRPRDGDGDWTLYRLSGDGRQLL